MRHTLLPLSICILCLAVAPALADGSQVKSSTARPAKVQALENDEMPAPQSSVVVSRERGVRVWRPVTGEDVASSQQAAGYAGGDQQASSYAPGGYGGGSGGYGFGGIYGGGVGTNGTAQGKGQEDVHGAPDQPPKNISETVQPSQPYTRFVTSKPNKPRPEGKQPMVYGTAGGQPKPMVQVTKPQAGLPGVHYGKRSMPVVYAPRAPAPKMVVHAKPMGGHPSVMRAPMPGRMALGGALRPHPMAHGRHR